MPGEPGAQESMVPLSRAERESRQGHRGLCVWLTGLPGAGKTTFAMGLERLFRSHGMRTLVLDGDTLRAGLSSDLGFAEADRREQVRRTAHVARLGVEQGLVVIVALVSPVAQHRVEARAVLGADDFLEVWVRCPVDVCARRDPKGLYAKAREGGLRGLTGVDSPYEPPDCPDVVLDTDQKPFSLLVDELASVVCDRCAAARVVVAVGT